MIHKHFLLIEKGCEHCLKWVGIVERINQMLPPYQRIKVVDTTEFQNWNSVIDPVILGIKWESTPLLYLDGTVVDGITTRIYAESYLLGRLKTEFM